MPKTSSKLNGQGLHAADITPYAREIAEMAQKLRLEGFADAAERTTDVVLMLINASRLQSELRGVWMAAEYEPDQLFDAVEEWRNGRLK